MRNCKPILLIEDDMVDAMTVKRAFDDLGIGNEIVHKESGEQALEYLAQADSVMPCLIFLDLNLPRMNGHEFLEARQQNSHFRSIPVVVLTTSTEQRDIAKCFESVVAGYVVKPISYDDFVEAVKVIESYWTLSELPCGGRAYGSL